MKAKNNTVRKYIRIIVLVLYISINIYLAFYHEMWRDEAQAWCIAKNASIK